MNKVNIIVWILGAYAAERVFCNCNTAEYVTCQSSELQTTTSDDDLCIPLRWICDGEEDCPHGSDETDCARCQPSMWMCHDGSLCISEDSRCDGLADCPDASDELSCGDTTDETSSGDTFIEEDAIVLIVDFNGPIYKIDVSDGKSSILYRDDIGCENVAYDNVLKHVYWSNIETHRIQRINLNGQDLTTVAEVSKCQGMVVDPISRLLFYSDDSTRFIKKLDLQTDQTTIIGRSSTSNRPHDVTADVTNKNLYWTELGLDPCIKMSDYNGKGVVTLLEEGTIPTALALDSTGTTLFWSDEASRNGDLMTIDLATNSLGIVPYGPQGNLFDIDILGTTLYLINLRQRSVFLTVAETGGKAKTISVPDGMSVYRHIKVLAKP